MSKFLILFLLSLCSTYKKSEKYTDLISKLSSNELHNIAFLVGAGASTAAGIPDFRSKSGLFEQLQGKYKLSRPEEFFDISTFLRKPQLFYEFQKKFFEKDYEPTLFHYFMGFLDAKNKLSYVYTQNIDGLDAQCGVRNEKVIFAHGNFLSAKCPRCEKEVDINKYNEHVDKQEILFCDSCGAPVKADIVFYGESLPSIFFEKSYELKKSDLVFICGCSLAVFPFNQLAHRGYISDSAYRVVINKINSGSAFQYSGFDFDGEDSLDIMMQGDLDEMVVKIIKDVGWEKEFNEYVKQMKEQFKKGKK